MIAEKECFEKLVKSAGVADGLGWTFVGYVYEANGQQIDLPPENPVDLVTEGMKQLPAPAVHYGPFPTRVAVKIPVWLWIDDPGQIVLDVPGLAISVHAVATLTSTTWTTGDPVDNPDDDPHAARAAAFDCTGTGRAPSAAEIADHASPACGYTYIWRSTASRTSGKCTWPITTTAHWTVVWTATNGAAGTLHGDLTAATAVHVGEWRTVLVDPAYPAPADAADPECAA